MHSFSLPPTSLYSRCKKKKKTHSMHWSILRLITLHSHSTQLTLCTGLAFLLSLFLIGRTVSSPNLVRTVSTNFVPELSIKLTFRSPNMLRTVRRIILRFLTDLLMRCKLQPELRCARCTQTRVHMFTHDTCSLSSIRGRKPR